MHSSSVSLDAARPQRIKSFSRYAQALQPEVLEADLALLRATAEKRAARGRLLKNLGWALLVGLPLVACSTARRGDQALILSFLVAVPAVLILRAVAPRPLSLRMDKVQTVGALLRRLAFWQGTPVVLRANLSDATVLADVQTTAMTTWKDGKQTTTRTDEWLTLEGRLSNGIALHVSSVTTLVQTISLGAQRRFGLGSKLTVTDTVALQFSPAQNPGLAQLGPSVVQSLQLPLGARVEHVVNQPGLLTVRVAHERAADAHFPEYITRLLVQVMAFVDPTNQVVLVDRDAYPGYQPGPAEIAAVRF